jgi:hypothetical protein
LNNALKALSKNNKTRYYTLNENYEKTVFNCFTESGINIITKEFKIDKYVYYQIAIVFTPKRLLKNKEFIEVTTEEDLKKVKKEFSCIMTPLKKEYGKKDKYKSICIFHNLENYYVKRIDFCVNIVCENSTKIMQLIRRGDIPSNFKPYLKEDKRAKIKKMPKGSFYISSNSVVINFYDKHYQVSKDNYYKDIDISNSEGIIRFEVQCKSQKVNNIKNKYDMDDKSIFNIATSEIAKQTLVYYLKKTIGLEDYFTLEEARIKINNSNGYRENTKIEMINIIELINKKRNIPRARLAYSGKEEKFNKVLKKIKELGINPVTIPLNWEIDYLPNPIHEIEKKFSCS